MKTEIDRRKMHVKTCKKITMKGKGKGKSNSKSQISFTNEIQY